MSTFITVASRGMEDLVYLFSCFLSYVLIDRLMFQFMGDRYEKAFKNQWVYRIAAAVVVVIVTLVNLKHNTWWNMGVNFLVFGIVSFICYEDKSGRRYWRVAESECFFIVWSILSSLQQQPQGKRTIYCSVLIWAVSFLPTCTYSTP